MYVDGKQNTVYEHTPKFSRAPITIFNARTTIATTTTAKTVAVAISKQVSAMFAARRTFTQVARRSFHSSKLVCADEAAAVASGDMVLNFSLPHEPIYAGKAVNLVIIPGASGEYGVTAGHTPAIAQLKAGVVEIHHEADDKDPEKFFVSGGFALTHANSVTDISAVEAVKLDDIDGAAAAAGLAESQAAFDSAAEGTAEKAEAQIGVETYQAMISAIGSA